MKNESTEKPMQDVLGNILLPAVVGLVFFAITFSYYPFREKLQFDTDEGLNLMRSMLVSLGHPLYLEVSSDQPPLLTHLLSILFRFAGFEVNPARTLILLFSTLLVWAGAQFLQLTWGKLSAILFSPLAFMVPRYLELSVSVMIGVPSIALALVSMLFVTLWHRNGNNIWLILSGFALALSMLIKLFTGFLAPVFFIGMTASMYFESREDGFSWKLLRPGLIWSMAFISLGTLLGLALVGPQNIWLIIYPHLAASSVTEFQGESNTIYAHLQSAVPIIFLGLIGAFISIYKRNWLSLYPLVWAVLAFLLLNFHSPVFYHHQLLITIPLAMLAAVGVSEGFLSLVRLRQLSDIISFKLLMGLVALVGFAWVTSSYLPVLGNELMSRPRLNDFNLKATPGKLKVLEVMNENADQTNWILTDVPMYAFRVHKPVPPDLATFSKKRLITGSLTEENILAAMDEYRPEQVLMGRFEIPSLEAYLKDRYTLILSEEFYRLFLRDDLTPRTK